MDRIICDVLVIGGGGAGLMAAYEASKYKANVAIVSKGLIKRSGATIMASGATAGVDERWKSEGDSISTHISDTIKGGDYLNDQDLVKEILEVAPNCILELERIGAFWQRNEKGDKYLLRVDGGHTYPRSVYIEDRIGKEIVGVLTEELRKRNVAFQEGIIITRIIMADNSIIGAIGIRIEDLEPVIFECNSIVLATGGAGAVYENTDNPIDLTGDGYALALEAGVHLKDMEFVQFFPMGLLFPQSLKGMLAAPIYYSRLINSNGERFMKRYDPERLELSTRDIVSRGIMQEVKEGRGTKHGGIYCDLTFNDKEFIEKMIPTFNKMYSRLGIDLSKDMFEVAPTCHFFMGGVDIDINCESNISGLFAAGEVTAGMHGANRLSQNALAEVMASGVIAGRNAAKEAITRHRNYINPNEAILERETTNKILNSRTGISPNECRKKIKNIMWQDVGVFRSKESLLNALKKLKAIENSGIKVNMKDRYYNREVLEALENRNLIITAKCVIKSALIRTESRGAHYRLDYPKTDNKNWLKNIIIKRVNQELKFEYKDVNLKIMSPEIEGHD